MLARLLHKIPQGVERVYTVGYLLAQILHGSGRHKLAQVLHGMTQGNWCIEGSIIYLRHGYTFAT